MGSERFYHNPNGRMQSICIIAEFRLCGNGFLDRLDRFEPSYGSLIPASVAQSYREVPGILASQFRKIQTATPVRFLINLKNAARSLEMYLVNIATNVWHLLLLRLNSIQALDHNGLKSKALQSQFRV